MFWAGLILAVNTALNAGTIPMPQEKRPELPVLEVSCGPADSADSPYSKIRFESQFEAAKNSGFIENRDMQRHIYRPQAAAGYQDFYLYSAMHPGSAFSRGAGWFRFIVLKNPAREQGGFWLLDLQGQSVFWQSIEVFPVHRTLALADSRPVNHFFSVKPVRLSGKPWLDEAPHSKELYGIRVVSTRLYKNPAHSEANRAVTRQNSAKSDAGASAIATVSGCRQSLPPGGELNAGMNGNRLHLAGAQSDGLVLCLQKQVSSSGRTCFNPEAPFEKDRRGFLDGCHTAKRMDCIDGSKQCRCKQATFCHEEDGEGSKRSGNLPAA